MPNGLRREEPLVLTNIPETAKRYRGLGREVLETPPTPQVSPVGIGITDTRVARRGELLRKFDESY